MTDFPLLVFPTHRVGKRSSPPKYPPKLHKPGWARQATNLGPKFEALRSAFEGERMALQTNPEGLAPEFVLVIETRGQVDGFLSAARKIGMDWLAEIDQEDLEPDDNFWMPDDKTGARSEKHLNGRLYLGMTNQQAMRGLLSLWERFRRGQDMDHGYKKWGELFDYTKDIRPWSIQDRLRPELLAAWREAEDNVSVPFRLELWFEEDGEARETALRRLIDTAGGQVLAATRIPEIRFHALKGRLPRAVAQTVLAFDAGESDVQQLSELFHRHEVRYFLPVAQGVVSQNAEVQDGSIEARSLPTKPEPIVALLDGYPLAGHHLLDGRLIVHDPDDTLSIYQPGEMRHGTAMASLILHDELDTHAPPLERPLYCRPVLEPDRGTPGREHIPETAFAEDRIHRAVVEMFEGQEPLAPTVRIVNLSIGEEAFDRFVSPWARLLDWLAFRHGLLFCVSAGNQTDDIETGLTDAAFQALPDADKAKATLGHLGRTLKDRHLLSPGESINALTVGAQHHDHSTIPYLAHRVDVLPDPDMASPVSRLGPGYRKSIKPDILLPGGRQLYRLQGSGGRYGLVRAPIAPGQQAAAPDVSGHLGKTTYTRGTSNATALASRAAARFYEILETLRRIPGGERIDRRTTAPLLKAMLVHGARWPDHAEVVAEVMPVPNHRRKRAIARFFGYGIADTARVEACTAQRATVLGCGLLKRDEVHEYELPQPIELSGSREGRRLTITLAWLTPVNPRHRAYRMAKLNFTPPLAELALSRQQADWQQVQNGTVQHEILEGEAARAFEDGDVLRIRISAQGDSQQAFDEEIPYGLVVSLEVGEASSLPIYQRVQEKLGVAVRANA